MARLMVYSSDLADGEPPAETTATVAMAARIP
jgi:hypothetical protein